MSAIEEYNEFVNGRAGEAEYSIIAKLLKDLEANKKVECVYARHDFSRPGENIIVITIISDGINDEINNLKTQTEVELCSHYNDYFYQIEVVDLNHILKMKDGLERNIFRMHLSDLYSQILLDRRGYFTRLHREIINICGPLGQINEYESIGDLMVDKAAAMIFSRTNRQTEQF